MAENEALGKAPTLEEEMSKFKGFAVKDGEPFDGKGGSAADTRADAEEQERRAGEMNRKPHAENVAAGKTSTEKTADSGGTGTKAAEVKLTEDEEEAALQALAKAKGTEDLSQEDMQKALDDALKAKKSAAEGKQGRQQRKSERYDENFRARRAAERRAERVEAELTAMRAELADIRSGKQPLTAKKDGATTSDELVKPDHTDTAKYQYGELDPKYLADLARFETLRAIRDEKANQGKSQQTEADAEAAEVFKERVEAFAEAGRDEFDDFDEVVTDTLELPKDDPAFWPVSRTMVELILESDHGRQVAYELASDPKEAKRIAKLSESRQAIWFGQQEAKISAGSAARTQENPEQGGQNARGKPAQETKPEKGQSQVRESKAPVPLRTKLNGSGGNRVPSSATTDFAAFESLANQKAK